tara:strand:- start:1026 stop:1706 length:681 start_codon:yes stop_codon:yes gene_type:complete
MAKYLQFITNRAEGGRAADYTNVQMDDVQTLWMENETNDKIVFVNNNFDSNGAVVYTVASADERGKVITYLIQEWTSLMQGSDMFRTIPLELPLENLIECTSNTWNTWLLVGAFDETDCGVILGVDINPGGLGSITMGSAFSNETGSGYYATATGTPCGTQDIAFLNAECGLAGSPVANMDGYFYTGGTVECAGDPPVNYCVIAKKVYNQVTFTGTIGVRKVTVPS